MSQYNKTVLTNAGLELAKRANAGQAKFEITRAVTSADDWSNKTIQDLEAVTAIPNIMQQGTIMDTEEVESNNSVMGVSLCFTNKNLSAGYQIRIIGLYVKEEGQENDFLYAVTTAVSPEYMPDFSNEVLYRFNMQLYLVIGKTQAVNVVINDGASVTHGQFDKYKGEVAANLEKIENTHKEDMSHVVKSASINGGDEILPNETGKLELVVPDPDLSKYVSLEQLGELLKTKADKADTYTKSNIDDIHSKSYFRKQGIDQNGNAIEIRKNAIKLDNGGYAFDIWNDDWTASKLAAVIAQLPNKADTSTVNAQIADAKNTIKSNVDNALAVDRGRLGKLEGTQTLDSPDFNSITSTGVYYITNNTPANIKNNPVSQWGVLVVSNGNGNKTSQVYYPDDGSPQWCRLLNGSNWLPWYQLSTKKDVSNAINKFDLSKVKFRKQYLNSDGDKADKTWSATKNDDGTYTIDLFNDDWTASKLTAVIAQLPNKADTSTVNAQIADAKNTIKSNVDNLQEAINNKANASDVYTKSEVDSKTSGTIITDYDIVSKTSTKRTDRYNNKWLVDQQVLGQFADQINQLKGRRTTDAPDLNALTDSGIYLITNPSNGKNTPSSSTGILTVFNGNGARITQIYFADDGTSVFMRTYGWINDTTGWLNWNQIAWKSDITDLQNQIQQLKDNQFEVQTFTDATAAANWEAQRPGKRMAIVNS